MDHNVLREIFEDLSRTNVTKTIRKDVYPAISPSRPELSQAGRVVLITGGSAGVGFNVAKSFVQASADTVMIIGRRLEKLETAASILRQINSTTKVITRSVDVLDLAQVNAFWDDLAAQGLTVDVFVANVGMNSDAKTMSELGADNIWSFFEIDVKAPIYFMHN